MNTAMRSSYPAPNHHDDESIIFKPIYTRHCLRWSRKFLAIPPVSVC